MNVKSKKKSGGFLNTGIFSKLRYNVSFAQLKQLYYSLVHPYISYAILPWEMGLKAKFMKGTNKTKHSSENNILATTRR